MTATRDERRVPSRSTVIARAMVGCLDCIAMIPADKPIGVCHFCRKTRELAGEPIPRNVTRNTPEDVTDRVLRRVTRHTSQTG